MSPRPASAVPGLRPLPLVDRPLALLRLFRDPLHLLPSLWKEHGEIAAISRSPPPLVCAFGPRYNKQLLPHSRDFEHFTEIPMRVPAGSALERTQVNLTAINGDDHRRQRRLMMPAFGKGVVQGYRDDMVAIAESRLARWREGATVDASQQMLELTLEVMMRCLFGLHAADEVAALGALGTEFLERIISPATALLPLDLPGLPYGRFMRVCERLEERMLQMIEQRRSAEQDGRDVLTLLVRAVDEDGGRLSDVELLGNMGLLFVAGYETTSYALAWTLLLLAQHPRVQADLRDELRAELGGDAPTIEQIGRLPLLDAVVHESTRLLPPTYMMFIRRARGELELGPYLLPEGTRVVLSPLVSHHMPRVYDQPDRFRPQRWLDRKPDPYELLPFGVGPRMCLGAGFAAQEIRLVVAMIVQRHAIRLRHGTRVDPRARGITMGPAGALPLELLDPEASVGAATELDGSIRNWLET